MKETFTDGKVTALKCMFGTSHQVKNATVFPLASE